MAEEQQKQKTKRNVNIIRTLTDEEGNQHHVISDAFKNRILKIAKQLRIASRVLETTYPEKIANDLHEFAKVHALQRSKPQ